MEVPVTRAAMDKLLVRLFNWTPTGEFSAAESELDWAIGSRYRERRYKPWREAWLLARLAEEVRADAVRLLREAESSPDGQLCLQGSIIDVEVTEVLEVGRRPGAERPQLARSDGPADWRARIAAMPLQLDRAARKKAKKPYAPQAILAVYLNPGGTYGIEHDVAEAAIHACIRKWSPSFRAVRVLWQEKWY